MKMEENLNELKRWATMVANSKSWKIVWHRYDISIDILLPRNETRLNVGEALALCHSELSEALDAYRDDNKEHFAEEIADEFIRLLHLCGDLDIDIVKSINDKILKNQQRPIKHGRKNY